MINDLSRPSGFPLQFDPQTCALTGGEAYAFEHSARSAADLADVLHTPAAVAPETTLFHLYHLASAPPAEWDTLEANDLAYGFTILPAGRIGREYPRTYGHSHPPAAGYSFSFPEIYAQVSGSMWLFLQKHAPGDLGRIEDCALIEMAPGDAVVIPPNHAHMQINPSPSEPSVTAGLYARLFKPEFDFYTRHKGFAYYLLDCGETSEALPNAHYEAVPPLRRLSAPAGGPIAPVEAGLPLWSSLMRRPEDYAFLSRPLETIRKFNLPA